MGIGSEFFFEDKNGDIRLELNDELFNIITEDRREANEMMLVLITELLREIDELSTELSNYENNDRINNILEICRHNHTMYIINQERIIQRIEEIESGN